MALIKITPSEIAKAEDELQSALETLRKLRQTMQEKGVAEVTVNFGTLDHYIKQTRIFAEAVDARARRSILAHKALDTLNKSREGKKSK